jgi:hypothetical protein
MALSGAEHVGTGAAVKLSTIIKTKGKQFDFYANGGNSATAYIGPSTVTAAGANAYLSLAKGKSWHARAAGQGEQVDLGDDLYIIAASSDQVHLSVLD